MMRFRLSALKVVALAYAALAACPIGYAQNLPQAPAPSDDQPRQVIVTEPFKIGEKIFRPEEIIIGVKDGQPVINQEKLLEAQQAAADVMMESLSIPKDSKFHPRITAAMMRGTGGNYTVASESGVEHPHVILKHLRSTAGIPLPDKNGLVPEKLPLTAAQIDEAGRKYYEAAMKTMEGVEFKAEDLPECTSGITYKDRPEVSKGEDALPEFDLLFLAKGKEPLSPQELYGQNTSVMTYLPGTKDAPTLIATGLGATCLPSRFRLRDGVMYVHLGRDALKNYDRNPDGVEVGTAQKKVKPKPKGKR